jgi:hypothetical protein
VGYELASDNILQDRKLAPSTVKRNSAIITTVMHLLEHIDDRGVVRKPVHKHSSDVASEMFRSKD